MAGDTTHAATHQAQWAAIQGTGGVSFPDVKALYGRMRAGRTWAQAVTDVFGSRPLPHQPSAAALAKWQPEVQRLVAAKAFA